MKRIPLYFFLTGIIAIVFYKLNINVFISGAFVSLIIILLIKRNNIQRLTIVLFIFFIIITSRIDVIHNHHNETINGDYNYFTGQIISYPVKNQNDYSFIVKLKTNNGEKVQCRIYDYQGELNYGDLISGDGIIRIPTGTRNPGGFNYRQYLKSKNIHYILTLDANSVGLNDDSNNSFVFNALRDIRYNIVAMINEGFDERANVFLRGVILGEKALDTESNDNFQQLGIAHILAVSGLHVGYIYLLIHFISRILRIGKGAELIIIVVFLYCYCYLVGFSISVIRASLMLLILELSRFYDKKYDTLNVLTLLGTLLLLINPYTLFTPGFQLSFGCVLAITLIYPYLNNKIKFHSGILDYIKSMGILTISIQVGVLPLMIYHFNSISMLSVVANILIVPIVGLVIVGFFICIILRIITGYFFVSSLIQILIAVIYYISSFLSSIPYTNIILSPLGVNTLIYYYLFLFASLGYFYLKSKKNDSLIKGIVIVNTLGFLLIHVIIPQPLKVTVLDVGQGDSILIETPGDKTILIDGGGQRNYSVGDNILLPIFLYKNIKKIDLVIATHSHNDHILGIIELLDDISIEGIMINCIEDMEYEELINNAKKYNIPIFTNDQAIIKMEDSVKLQCIYPKKSMSTIEGNNSSIVSLLKYKDISFLFTGDLEEDGERLLLQENIDINSLILKVGHHGSNTSSSKEFIERVNPQYAIISVGKNNYFGHPSQEILNLLEEKAVQTYRTDINGAIEITTYGETLHIREYGDKGE